MKPQDLIARAESLGISGSRLAALFREVSGSAHRSRGFANADEERRFAARLDEIAAVKASAWSRWKRAS